MRIEDQVEEMKHGASHVSCQKTHITYNCEFLHLGYSIILIGEINIVLKSSLMKEISTECGPENVYRQERLTHTEMGQAGFREGLPERCRKIQRMDGQPGTREEGKRK